MRQRKRPLPQPRLPLLECNKDIGIGFSDGYQTLAGNPDGLGSYKAPCEMPRVIDRLASMKMVLVFLIDLGSLSDPCSY